MKLTVLKFFLILVVILVTVWVSLQFSVVADVSYFIAANTKITVSLLVGIVVLSFFPAAQKIEKMLSKS